MPFSVAVFAMLDKSIPRPSSLTEISMRLPMLKASSRTMPVAGFPAAKRSFGVSIPCPTALRTRCNSGSAMISASDLSIPTSPPMISNSMSFAICRAATRPARAAAPCNKPESGTSRNLISRSSSCTKRRRKCDRVATISSLLEAVRKEIALVVSRNKSLTDDVSESNSLSPIRTEGAGRIICVGLPTLSAADWEGTSAGWSGMSLNSMVPSSPAFRLT